MDYGTVIFKATGINNSFVTQMILGGVNFGTTFLGLYVVDALWSSLPLAISP
jgi:SP family sugar:H+ symporter-like MFS transporter